MVETYNEYYTETARLKRIQGKERALKLYQCSSSLSVDQLPDKERRRIKSMIE